MRDLNAFFEDRVREVESYVELLSALERQAQEGPLRLIIESGNYQISTLQQKILYSSVFVQLYNLVESTISICIEEVANASKGRLPAHLRAEIQREWIRNVARTHVELTPENRLDSACAFFGKSASPIGLFSIEKGGGGNWDDIAIEQIGKRLGFQVTVERAVFQLIKRKIRDDLGPLGVVKDFRNKLAHGGISFSECAEGVTVAQLIEIKTTSINYMRGVLLCFKDYINNLEFLEEQHRSA